MGCTFPACFIAKKTILMFSIFREVKIAATLPRQVLSEQSQETSQIHVLEIKIPHKKMFLICCYTKDHLTKS